MLKYTTSPNIKPSFAEMKVAAHLKSYGVPFVQEVSFDKCRNPETLCMLRFDFFLPTLNILIEYDGLAFHKSEGVKKRDAIKSQFAKTNHVRLIRIQGLNKIDGIIDRLHFGTSKQRPKAKQVKVISKPKKKRKNTGKKDSIMTLLGKAASGPYRSQKTK